MEIFHRFVPLSNWLRGFDRYTGDWGHRLMPEVAWRGVLLLVRKGDEAGLQIARAKAADLIKRLALPGDRIVRLEFHLPTGAGAAEPNRLTGTDVGWVWPRDSAPLEAAGWADGETGFVPASFEEITARAFRISGTGLSNWADCRPRSLSALPVARACPGRCPFCFSSSSVSSVPRDAEGDEQFIADARRWARAARNGGARRSVITGGGEPTLKGCRFIARLASAMADSLDRCTVITNGREFDRQSDRDLTDSMRVMRDSGIEVLALSRHGNDAESDRAITGLSVDFRRLARAAAAAGITPRAVCVIGRHGVDTTEKAVAYAARCVDDGFTQVCFKELYVSAAVENSWASARENEYCRQNRAPLAIAITAAESIGMTQIDALPWGSPLFRGRVDGRPLSIAAYTEPSPGWERSHSLVRSWNLLADGSCLASLEDSGSAITLDGDRGVVSGDER